MFRKVLLLTVVVLALSACRLEAAVVYEVWAGDTDYSGEPYSWEYYYSIDQQDYVKLGESDGQSKFFSGDYNFYVIAAREEFFLDSVQGSTGDYYSGGLSTGGTSDPDNILGAPDSQCATVGCQSGGGTFRGYVVITNPGDWTGLTVITVQPVVEVVDSIWVGGDEGCWCVSNNWDPPIVPDNNALKIFNVAIDSNYVGEEEIEVHLQQTRNVNELCCYGSVCLEKWTSDWVQLILTDANGITNYGNLEIDDEMNIQGNITNKTGAYLNGCLDIEDGNLVNEAGARIDATDDYMDIEDGSIYNYGTILITQGEGLWVENEFQNNGTILIYGSDCTTDDLFLNDSNGVIEGYGVIHSEQIIVNDGFIKSIGGGLNFHSRSSDYNPNSAQDGYFVNTGTLTNSSGTMLTIITDVADFNNTGTILINSDGAVVFDCNNLKNEPNGIIALRGGSLEADNIINAQGAQFSGLGSINGNLSVEANATVSFTGPTIIIGDVNVPSLATLEISDGQTLIIGQTTNNGTIHLIGGTAVFQGGYTGNGEIVNDAGQDRSQLDINKDGIQDMQDFAVFADNWLWQATWY